MSKETANPRPPVFPLLSLSLFAACLLCLSVVEASAQQARASNAPRAATPAAAPGDPVEEPTFREYKGVRIGMSTDEARKLLGAPTDKSDSQDFYLVSEKETVQVMYDG